jgi:ABC-type nitrate/sulfonate/bicarbonate transport system substrate-binding protein
MSPGLHAGIRGARHRRSSWLVIIIVSFSMVYPARAQAPLPNVKLRLGIISALFDAGSLIAIERGYFREQGIDVEVKPFPGSSDANQALSIGAIDVLPTASASQSSMRGCAIST